MRLTWIAAAIIVASSSAQANTELEQQLSFCAMKADKLDRLVCYDELSAKVVLASENSKAVAVILPAVVASQSAVTDAVEPISIVQKNTSLAVTTPPVQVEAFGFRKTIEEDIEKLYFEVSGIDKDPYGALIITLTNGQIWKQTDSERYRVNKGQKIYIEKGALSSFLLGTDDRNSTTRVKRIK
ncbi:hypothetical protein [Shewanella sp. OMA3-2]|uniref:hypothetical protein n=1 Tax=Shewanella sp. OMA3-2 TaxID=2908650 RepID=UPI001F321674|nr:hypothetical protein [Shewanella sp. OMA3-2]UJF21916.1 hypothetical protein L0B17_00070 [Shewanella sp. OMA3-2]